MPVASDYLPEMFAEHPGLVFEVEERSVGEVLQTLRSMNMYPPLPASSTSACDQIGLTGPCTCPTTAITKHWQSPR